MSIWHISGKRVVLIINLKETQGAGTWGHLETRLKDTVLLHVTGSVLSSAVLAWLERRMYRMTFGTDRSPNQHQKKPSFSHPSEREFARILDFYGVHWEYEPQSFLLKSEGDRVVEMFTPDFYLPDLDLYVELTTMRQSLVTKKNRKLRHLKELYPEINIILLYRRDYYRLLAKYGYGPLAQADVGIDRVLITSGEIQQKVAELGHQISQDYAGIQPVLVGVLKGVLCFMSDLIRQVSLPLSVEFLSISYFGSSGEGVRITKDLDRDINDCHVLMVEDIVDTGMTLNYLLNYLRTRRPASLKVCALLDKRVRRLVDVPLEYRGFEIPDEFVVGYGLDYLERYRNLPYIGVLKPETREEEIPGVGDEAK